MDSFMDNFVAIILLVMINGSIILNITTMNKKYRYAKVDLLVGLLSLNILSSCVHTRQALGVDTLISHAERGGAGVGTHNDDLSENSNSSLIRPVGYALATGLFVSTVITLGVYGFIWGLDWALGHLGHASNIPTDANTMNQPVCKMPESSLVTLRACLYPH